MGSEDTSSRVIVFSFLQLVRLLVHVSLCLALTAPTALNGCLVVTSR